jgi:hypothetical protein
VKARTTVHQRVPDLALSGDSLTAWRTIPKMRVDGRTILRSRLTIYVRRELRLDVAAISHGSYQLNYPDAARAA